MKVAAPAGVIDTPASTHRVVKLYASRSSCRLATAPIADAAVVGADRPQMALRIANTIDGDSFDRQKLRWRVIQPDAIDPAVQHSPQQFADPVYSMKRMLTSHR